MAESSDDAFAEFVSRPASGHKSATKKPTKGWADALPIVCPEASSSDTTLPGQAGWCGRQIQLLMTD
jgi:hypothetical protein